ncbi:hypothetical protein AN8629.2 [Aspergillus nidulans FGSC A4]|uniref:DUF521 domain protein (AFU_orthologue AFUA_6G00490) n=1 Tax=Emericella nidulans (strain FGSC A4 / ATCC 38163 / CBS 112.46 / NRRL 194 / M139) TaxID=227321 RepID=Q5ASV1_EMENI|nr:hypothetical protein [Aspergillus nidulans FGSC A4]EAA60663.1 hypothetical protein AN8629.2 [Aspergillus nidulans FGSC A4]CBF78298.1 TPA: DUF521 domain protein (AFU_orthologue; AFUA_6G00490) [Aspergillus nidulans FGSC A4]|eukprot:XP_681898.1 hypothetical protein AN8629.2 [Aspergillus nidulans FGSC A4]
MKIYGKAIVHGAATGEILYSKVPLSFWGGVEQTTGDIIDHHHPLFGENIKDRVLVLPSTRGSCSGSLVLIELLVNRVAPTALVFWDSEAIVTTGVIVARTLLGLSLPVYRVSQGQFEDIENQKYLSVRGPELLTSDEPLPLLEASPPQVPDTESHIYLNEQDKAILNGCYSPAASRAMEILLQYAHLQDARQLIPVSRAHIDACIYTGPASILIAHRFLSQGAHVAIPTTLNSISVDQRRWREVGVDKNLASEANRLANAYVAMGAESTFTCAPYLLDSPPGAGDTIGWAESNAVVFANSVLGARTQKYPDLIDVCIALTGRAPLAGVQITEERAPRLCIDVTVQKHEALEDVFYPLLGYAVGTVVAGNIPLITGLESTNPTRSDLKAFSAAFATTASAPMFHISGITPEAKQFDLAGLKRIPLADDNLLSALNGLITAADDSVGLVSLGNPHFSLEEFARFSELCTGRRKADSVQVIITTNRQIYAQACAAGHVGAIETFGAQILTDTCWCMMSESVMDSSVVNLMTNSAKYAHYAPGIVRRGVHFGTLKDCIAAAETGRAKSGLNYWLSAVKSA